MSDAEKGLLPVHFFGDRQEELLRRWRKDIKSNPHFQGSSFSKDETLNQHSKMFINALMKGLDSKALPLINSKSLKPIFSLWKDLHNKQLHQGMDTKDLAMMIFSFKSSLMNYLKEQSGKSELGEAASLGKLQGILDFLGLLTFEFYTAEKDHLIGRQKDQIHFLQDKRRTERFGKLIGNSAAMSHVYKAVGMITGNDITVLLQGESGTGKDVLASSIHAHSKRKKGPFITLNCGAIPKELIESELFGHEKGSFTGADEKRRGKFELAHKGTLFLDEIGELPLEMQVKLLRVLQNKEIERVGGHSKVNVDVRIISATNLNLEQSVKEKKFRLDLFYRLNIFPITVPPLRERIEDIESLASYFIQKYADEFKVERPYLTQSGLSFLQAQTWKGNVRELENYMQRAVILAPGNAIDKSVLEYQPGKTRPLLLSGSNQNEALVLPENSIVPLDQLEELALKRALKIKKGNIKQCADALGISRTTFYNKAKKFGISLE